MSQPPRSKSGTVLMATLIISLALTAVLAGLLGWVNTEARISRRNLVQVKAQYAAEATAEYALAQMRCVLQQKPVYVDSLFASAGTPPTTPNASILGSSLTSVLTGVTGSGSSGFATNVISSLASLQGSATTTSSPLHEITNATITVGSFSPETPLVVDAGTRLYADDPLRGKKVNVRTVKVLARATVTDTQFGDAHTAYVEETLQVRDTPLVGYGMFYNVLMEIAPGAAMDVFGPIHSNRDIYAQSNAGLTFNGVVTTAGKIFHGRAPGSGQAVSTGDVKFLNSSGTLTNMLQGGSWIDSARTDWISQSSTLWGGNVLTASTGVNPSMPANVPPYTPDNPATTTVDERVNDAHMLIDPATKITNTSQYQGDDTEVQKFVSQASLIFTVTTSGAVKVYKYKADANGEYIRKTTNGVERVSRVELSLPANLIVGGGAVDNKFYDMRRAKWIDSVDLDVGKLKSLIEVSANASQWTNGSNTFNPSTEWNGVVFVENSDTTDGSVRLVNGRYLPNLPTSANEQASGFTLATNVPVYIKGNYNADGTISSTAADIRNYETGEVPAAIAADAITILSNAWNDTNSSNTSLSSRTATKTEVSAAFVTGVVPTNRLANGRYSGGVENLPRFLETWSGVTFGYRGALIVLYESIHATESWGSSNVYDAPKRVWGYSKMFEENNGPPLGRGTRTFRRLGFRHLSPQEYATALAGL